MTNQNTTTVTISAKHYAELIQITHALRSLSDFFDDSDIDFPATDLTPALHSLCFRLSTIIDSSDTDVSD